MAEKRKFTLFLLTFVLLVSAPYLFAYFAQGESHFFSGLLFNVKDGSSYFAKMYQGGQGEWRFVLPYTSEPGDGAYLFLFYLFLGHLSSWFHIPIVLLYHLARVLAAVLLLLSMLKFYVHVFGDKKDFTFNALLLAAVGSGSGWLLLFFGKMTSDFWVAEAYPFLSCFANPHFPLGIALMLWIVMLATQDGVGRWRTKLLLFLLAVLLSVVMPFGVVVTIVIVVVDAFVAMLLQKQKPNWCFVFVILGSAPFLVYQYWATVNDEVLRIWNLQNVTPTPPWWDLLLSLSPALVLSFLGVVSVLKAEQFLSTKRVVLVWLLCALALLCIPFSLQRRFIIGIFIPVAALAVIGLEDIFCRYQRWKARLWLVVMTLSVVTNIILLVSIGGAVLTHNANIYLSKDEHEALQWIEANTLPRDIVLCSPEMGLFIPAYTGRRVIYGHPFETIHAEEESGKVMEWYQGDLGAKAAHQFVEQRQVAYILCGTRERRIGCPEYLKDFEAVFTNSEITIFRAQ